MGIRKEMKEKGTKIKKERKGIGVYVGRIWKQYWKG